MRLRTSGEPLSGGDGDDTLYRSNLIEALGVPVDTFFENIQT